MLKLVNDTAYLTNNQIRSMFTSYPQFEFDDAPDLPIITDTEGTFANNPEGVFITDIADTVHAYGGATYIFGAVTVYDVGRTINRLGNKLGKQVVRLRILHEILHHYNLDADRIDDWFILEKHPILALLYQVFGKSSGETWIGSAIQEQFYRFLLSTIEISHTEIEFRIPERTYQGLLIN